jgi:hypothetical protein
LYYWGKHIKKHFNKLKSGLAIAALSTITFSSAFANLAQIDGSSVVPKILAGGVDAVSGAPLLPAGAFTGVVSINIRSGSDSGICTGTVISKRHIITAAHCIEDGSGTGAAIDISGANDVRAVFTDGGAFNDIMTASHIKIHPDYDGFANCSGSDAAGFTAACLNDDIAIITLGADIPAGVEIYGFSDQAMDGQLLTMVGHGKSGNGITGDAIAESFLNKRIGFNFAEIWDCDDATSVGTSGGYFNSGLCETNFGNEAEVWYADFDGFDANGVFQDTWCNSFSLGCSDTWLGETFSQPYYDFATLFEANIGGGDSGGPSFVYDAVTAEFKLIGSNTFGAGDGSYGTWFGGNVYAGYKGFIAQFVPAPSGLGLVLVAFGAVALRHRKIEA